MVPIIVKEGIDGLRGETCCDPLIRPKKQLDPAISSTLYNPLSETGEVGWRQC
jgi:hypothetical protein